ncbi:CARDB domain-containing protein [Shimia sp. MMG029]|uniref:CARDB domain-containing protein n=1 Tax=Shimia sp. MMG029 TaxID=3021978 RepID=UPI0022FDE6C6|nr:CARDB domain-containing protein [Shimia sp. MMG029]MDA5555682.1 CARDB domain-containing protein [Shimia sp. MMG029]
MATTNSDLATYKYEIKLLGNRVTNGVHEADLQFRVDNTGNDAAEASRYKIVVLNPFDRNSEIVVAEGDIPTLGQYRSATITARDVTAVLQESYPELMGLDLEFQVIVDSDNIIVESNENNNTASRVFDIPHLDPDLATYKYEIKLLGNRVTNGVHEADLQFRVGNTGNDAAEASRYKIVVLNPFDRNSEIVVAEGDIPAIGQNRSVTITARDVTAVLQESYPELMGLDLQFKITVDSDDIIVESNENNNTASRVFDIPEIRPDLSVKNLALIGGEVIDGIKNFDLEFDYTLNGVFERHGDIGYKVVVYSTNTPDAEFVISEGQIPYTQSVVAGNIVIEDVGRSIYTGSGFDLGDDFEFRVEIDHDQLVSESNENNNFDTLEEFLPNIITDAYVTGASVSDLSEGDSFVFTATLGGNNNLSTTIDYDVVAVDQTTGEIYSIASATSGLDTAGESEVIEIQNLRALLDDAGAPDGPRDYVITAILDPENLIVESFEFNNSGSALYDL